MGEVNPQSKRATGKITLVSKHFFCFLSFKKHILEKLFIKLKFNFIISKYFRVADKMVSFEVSLGNAGNGVDGELTTGNKSENFDNDDESKFYLTHL